MRGLAPPLPVTTRGLFFDQLDRRGRDGFMDVAAAETSTVFTVPVTFGNHSTAAAGAISGQDSLHYQGGYLLLLKRHLMKALRLPPGLADGFGL